MVGQSLPRSSRLDVLTYLPAFQGRAARLPLYCEQPNLHALLRLAHQPLTDSNPTARQEPFKPSIR